MSHLYTSIAKREAFVKEFTEATGGWVDMPPLSQVLSLRRKLILEETREVVDELDNIEMLQVRGKPVTQEDYAKLMKELCDLQYVLSGTVIAFEGLPTHNFVPAFNRVHASNMSKLDDNGKPVLNEYGKVMKGPNYKEPTMEGLV